MSLKIKLISCISLFMLMLGVLIIGVYAATQQQLILQGSVNFNVPDKSLYVKAIRIRQDMASEPESIDGFMPGYINENFTLDLTGLIDENTYGSFQLYFDIINTTDIQWAIADVELPSSLTGQGVSASYSGVIPTNNLTDTDSDGYKNFDSSTPIDGSLILTITAPNSDIVDLQGIVVTIDEILIVTAISSDENLGAVEGGGIVEIGDEVTLTADFTGNADADFLGWRAESEDGELVSTMPEYTFILGDNTPFTYYAVFTEPNTGITYDNSLSDPGETAIDAGTNMSPGGVFASALDNGFLQVPAMIYRDEKFIVSEIEGISVDGAFANVTGSLTSLILPDSIENIGMMAFWYCRNLTSLDLPSNLKTIGIYAFGYCSGLTSITIPESVTSIGSYAFTECSGLTSITINATTPPRLESDPIPSNVTNIYVPEASVGIYQKEWYDYAVIISAIVA